MCEQCQDHTKCPYKLGPLCEVVTKKEKDRSVKPF